MTFDNAGGFIKKNVTEVAEQLKHNCPPAYVSNVINIKLSISINHAKLT